jgi:predicted small lipoprotein YifL
MKKFVSVLLVMMLVLGCFAACGTKVGAEIPTEEGSDATVETVTGPASSLEVLENIWALYADEEKFSVYGGNPKENFEDNVWDAPGTYDLADENMSYNLLIPADQIPNVDDVASMTHGMMANNFNSAVFRLKAGTDVKVFADSLYQAVSGNMWICGMPESVIVATLGDYVIMAYGVGDAMNSFEDHLPEAYPNVEIVYNEPIM